MSSIKSGVHLNLLGGFEVRQGCHRMRIPLGAQRLLALLAVREEGISRGVVAEELWPGSRRGRAGANLRAALSQAKKIGPFDVIGEFDAKLHLVESVEVDVSSASSEARAIVDASQSYDITAARQVISTLSRELLSAWFDGSSGNEVRVGP